MTVNRRRHAGGGALRLGVCVTFMGAVAIHEVSATQQSETQPTLRPQRPRQVTSAVEPAISPEMISEAITRGVDLILAGQEGDSKAEWPYEGVYRVGGQIPIGYRIGGTGICARALLLAPGYADDSRRHEAVLRATKFIIEGASHPLMSWDYQGGYDVRGWGYTYGLAMLLQLKAVNAVPKEMSEQVEKTITGFIDSIQRTEIAKVGGWNYARGPGKDAVSPPSPFMTAPTLQALFQARKLGYAVDDAVVNRALDTLSAARTPSGSFRYAGIDGDKSNEPVPGAVGRMLAGEVTLHLAGRTSVTNIRGAVDAFIVHWEWLNKRRAQQGTHMPPYSIAPYYFYYAHFYAAQAVELLPENERAEYRRRINDLLFSTRSPNGTWNDRVFPRSANYGTAMSIMALMMPTAPRPAEWK